MTPTEAGGVGRRPAEGALGAAPERPEAGRRPATGPAADSHMETP